MLYSNKIKPYKFVNPNLIKVPRFAMASAIKASVASEKNDAAEEKSAASSTMSSKKTLLGLNRLGASIYSLGDTQRQIRDVLTSETSLANLKKAFLRRKEQYLKDQQSEENTESIGKGAVDQEEIKEEGKKELSWIEKLLGPFKGIIEFAVRTILVQGVLRWISDPKNGERLGKIVEGATKFFKFIYGVVAWSIDQFMSGVSNLFGDGSKTGFARFAEVLGGLGQIILGIAALKAASYLLNPFSLIGDVLGLLGGLFDRKPQPTPESLPPSGGGAPTPNKPALSKPAQKVAENYGDEAAKYYDDLIKRGKKPVDALKAVRGKFTKLPPIPAKPQNALQKMQGFFGDKLSGMQKGVSSFAEGTKKGLLSGWENVKKFGNSISKGAREKLAKSGEFLKDQVKKRLEPLAKGAYDLLEKKGIISTAKKLGQKATDLIKKVPGYDKIMKKVAKEGGPAALKKLGGKAIPVIGGLVNLYFAYDRLKQGDKSGAVLESLAAILDLSGLFGFAPGPALSLALDAYLFGRDFFPDVVKKENEVFQNSLNAILGPIKGVQSMLPKVPMLAEGGIITKPTQAVLGERGPEVLVPLSKMQGAGGDSSFIATTIASALEGSLKAMGSAGEVARQVIGADLQQAKMQLGVGSVPPAQTGETLSKSVVKGLKSSKEDDPEALMNQLIGDRPPATSGNAQMTTLRGALANVAKAFIDVSNMKFTDKGKSGGSSGGPSGAADGSSGSSGGSATGEWGPLLDLISAKESGGNYEAMYPSTTLKGATKMTIAEVAKKATGAVGKYQQLPQYLVSRAKAAGLDPNKDLYSKENQDLIVSKVNIEQNRGGKSWLQGKKSDDAFMHGLAFEFASLPGPDGKFKYKGQSSSHKPSEVKEALKKVKGEPAKMAGGGAVREWNKNRAPKEDVITLESKAARQPAESWTKFAAGGKYKNGLLPEDELESVGSGHKLHKSIAKQFRAMIASAKSSGHNFNINSSYRSYQRQKELYASLGPGTAAYPGTSNHGLGLAVDLNYTNAGYKWLRKNASKFGFRQIPGYETDNPDGHEAWHWENVSGKGSIDGGSGVGPSNTGGGNESQTGEQEAPEKTREEQIQDFIGQIASSIVKLNTLSEQSALPQAKKGGKVMKTRYSRMGLGEPPLHEYEKIDENIKTLKGYSKGGVLSTNGSVSDLKLNPSTPFKDYRLHHNKSDSNSYNNSRLGGPPVVPRDYVVVRDFGNQSLDRGAPVVAGVDGKVVAAGGHTVVIAGNNGKKRMQFHHFDSIAATVGKAVQASTVIGKQGNKPGGAVHVHLDASPSDHRAWVATQLGGKFDDSMKESGGGGGDTGGTGGSDTEEEAPEKSREEQIADLISKISSDIIQLNTGMRPEETKAAATDSAGVKTAPSAAPGSPAAGNPPGALAPGQRSDKALNKEQFAAAQKARAEGKAAGLSGKELESYVANAVMGVPQKSAAQLAPPPSATSTGASVNQMSQSTAAAQEQRETSRSVVPVPLPINSGGMSSSQPPPPTVVRSKTPITYGF
jgi:hypothetical protein